MNDFGPKDKVNEKAGLFAAAPPLRLVKMPIIKAARRNWVPAWRHQDGHDPGCQPGTSVCPDA